MAYPDTRFPTSSLPYRTQRALSISAETREPSYYDNDDHYSTYHHPPSPLSPFSPQLSHDLHLAPVNDLDLYRRPTSQPLPASGLDPATCTPDPKKTESSRPSKKDQLTLKLNQHSKHDKLEKQQAKLERKQKREEYKQMYQNQYDYQQLMEERRFEKLQQRSLPIYPSSASSSTSMTCGKSPTDESRLPQSSAPLNEIFYHSSRHYHRPSHHNNHTYYQDPPFVQHRVGSLSSTTSAKSSSEKDKVSAEKQRSFSLKSQSTKSMNDLRPWSGGPHRSSAFDSPSGYDSDDTSVSYGWDSLMDTLYSPSVPRPMDSPSWEASCKDEADLDVMESSFNNMNLSHDNNKSGNGKYLLVLGANGRTGLELVRQGLERNYRVTAFVRDDKVLLEDSALRKNQNLLIVRGCTTCQADLDRCIEGQDVVVNVIGARLMSGDPTISSHVQVVLNNSMKKHGVRRLIAVTSYGCQGLRNYLINTKKLFSRMFMTGILKDKVLQEEIIQRDSASLDWTIVRPITLKDGELTEKYIVSSDELPKSNKVKVLTRRDLAHYLLEIINTPEEHHAIRSVAGMPKSSKPKQYSIDWKLEKRREVPEPAKQQRKQ
ncbi:hypothetical protein BGX28_001076 [Mortierella sp. GBA30]|nr:hypothetical protein BGX28_001076 [Mortierella sp. GBA30]